MMGNLHNAGYIEEIEWRCKLGSNLNLNLLKCRKKIDDYIKGYLIFDLLLVRCVKILEKMFNNM